MRRLLLSAACFMPLTVLFGCNHMAGRCDCDPMPTIHCPCYGHAVAPIVKPPEPIKELPKPKPEPDKE